MCSRLNRLRAGLTFRGAHGILSARGPLTPPPPQPSNGILDTEFSKIKKYPLVFHALKGFLCIYKQKELYINNLIELSINPVYTINIIITYRRKIAKHDTIHMHEPRSLEPLAQRRNKKKLFAALLLEPRFLNFGASCFFIWGLRF